MTEDELKKRLDYYLERDNPDYAVMITGKWGTGKTYFIKEYIKNTIERDAHNRFVYLSLYGAKDESDIEKRIWPQIIKLSIPDIKTKIREKKTILLCLSALLFCIVIAVIRDEGVYGFISLLLRIIGTATLITIGVWLYDIVKIYLLEKSMKEHTAIVFDDFERAKLPYDRLLAYLNRYVEHLHKHIIIVCNEYEVQKNKTTVLQEGNDNQNEQNQNEQNISSVKRKKTNEESLGSSYQKLKEKVIGESYPLEHDSEPIQRSLIEKENFPIIEHIIKQGKTFELYFFVFTKPDESVNYRVWIQCCHEFEYTFRNIPLQYFENRTIITMLLPCFFSLTYALRINDFGKERIFSKDRAKMLFCNNDNPNEFEWFLRLFLWKIDYKSILPNGIWDAIIEKKDFDKTEIIQHWDQILLKFYPLWLKVYNYLDQTDKEMDKTWKELKNAYMTRSVHNPAQIASIFFSVEDMITTHCIPSKKITHKIVLGLALRYIKSVKLEFEGDIRPNIDRILTVCETYGHHKAPSDDREIFRKEFTLVLQKYDFETTIPNRFEEFLRILNFEEDLFRLYWIGDGMRIKLLFERQSSKKLLDRLLDLSPKLLQERIDSIEDHLFNVFPRQESYLDFETSLSKDLSSLFVAIDNNTINLSRSVVYILHVLKDDIDKDIEKKRFLWSNNTNYIFPDQHKKQKQ